MATPKWHEGRAIAFDVESTGVSIHTDRIVTAAIVHHTPGERPRTLTWLIDPGVPVPAEAAAIHGWTSDRIKTELAGAEATRTVNGHTRPITREQALFEIGGHVALPMSTSTPLVAFNASYDLSILEAECTRHSVPTLAERLAPKGIRGVVDPFVIDKKYSRRKGSRKLVDQCAHYQVLHGGAHTADADALATLRVLARQVAAYPELGRLSLGQLFDRQVGWRAEQMGSLRKYFDRVGKPHDGCCGSFPVHGDCCAPAPAEQGALL